MQSETPKQKCIYDLLKIEGCRLKDFEKFIDPKYSYLLQDANIGDRITVQSMYEDEEEAQLEEINDIKRHEAIALPADFDYKKLTISNESKEKLLTHRPTSLGAASRIPGIAPSAIFQLYYYFRDQNNLVH